MILVKELHRHLNSPGINLFPLKACGTSLGLPPRQMTLLCLALVMTLALHLVPGVCLAKTRATNLTLTRPDRARLHFSGPVTLASATDRTAYSISGNCYIQSVTPLPATATQPEAVELRISGLVEGAIQSLAIATMTCPDGSTTEALSLALETQAIAQNRGSWGNPISISPSSGIFHTPNLVSSANSLVVSSIQGLSSSDTAGLVLFHSPDQGVTFAQRSIGTGTLTAHISTSDALYPDMDGAPVLNPGAQLASENGRVFVVWTSLYFDEGRVHLAVSEDNGSSFPDSQYITVNLGQDTVACTPCISVEDDLITVLITKSTLGTDISSNKYTNTRTLELLRFAKLSTATASGKTYSLISQETLVTGSPATSWPAAPQGLIKDRSLHLAYTAFNPSARTCKAVYGRYDFDDARGKFKIAVALKELAPYHALTTGPRLTWCNSTLIAAMVTTDLYGKTHLIYCKSTDGGSFFADPSPVTTLLQDFMPWEESPVYPEVFTLFSGALNAGETPRPLLMFKDLRPSPDYTGRTIHRLLLIRGQTDCTFKNDPETLGAPADGTYYEATARGASLCFTGTKLSVAYIAGEVFQESAASGFSRLKIRHADSTPPRLLSASVTSPTTIQLNFDEVINSTLAAQISCYSFSQAGLTIYSAVPSDSGTQVTLTTSSMVAGMTLTILVTGLSDLAGNVIAAQNGTYSFTVPGNTDPASGWTQPVRLSHDAASSSRPSIAITGDEIYVGWSDDRDDSTWSGRPNSEIYCRRSTNSGLSWESVLRLTNNLEASINLDAASSSQGIVLAWQDFRDKNHEIYLGWFSPGGGTWSGDIRITRDTNVSSVPAVAMKGENIYIAWADAADGDNEIYVAYSHDMGVTWSQKIQISDNSSESVDPAIAIAPSGNLIIAWEDDLQLNRAIYARVWSEDPLQITDSQAVSGSLPATDPALACDDAGRVSIAWTAAATATTNQFFYCYSLDGGLNFSSPANLSSHAGQTAGISMASSGSMIYAAYSDDREGLYNVYVATTSDGGVHFTSGFCISPTLPQDAECNSTYPSVALWNSLAAVAFERDLYGNGEIYISSNSGLIPDSPAISVASFTNPSDSLETFALIKSSKELETVPSVTATLPDNTGVTLEVTAVRDLLWLAKYRGNGNAFGLTRINARGIDLFGNLGSGTSSLVSARVTASCRVETGDSRFLYQMDEQYKDALVKVCASSAGALGQQKDSSAKRTVGATLGEDVEPLTQCYTCSMSGVSGTRAGSLLINASVDSLLATAELVQGRRISSGAVGIYSMSQGAIEYLGAYSQGASIEVSFDQGVFLATDCRAPVMTVSCAGLSEDGEYMLLKVLAQELGSGMNEQAAVVSFQNRNIRAQIMGISGDEYTLGLSREWLSETAALAASVPELTVSMSDMAGNSGSAKVTVTAASSPGIRAFYGWPNPADRQMTIRFDSGTSLNMDDVKVKVFDFSGHCLRTIPGSDFTLIPLTAGLSRYEAAWNLTDSSDEALANGTYFLRLEYTGLNGGKFFFKAAVLR